MPVVLDTPAKGRRPRAPDRGIVSEVPTPRHGSRELARGALVVASAAVLILLVSRHVHWMNGMLWVREWRSLPLLDALPLILAGALPLAFACARWCARGAAGRLELALAASTAGLLTLAGCYFYDGTFGPERLPLAIEHQYVTSYFQDALRLADHPGFLAEYPRLMDTLHLHSENKPPGPVLFFLAFLELFGAENAALVCGLALAALAALVVVSVHWMASTLHGSRDAAFGAAALMALCPGLVLTLPSMDAVMPHFTCLLVGTWAIALRRDSPAAALLYGLVLALAAMFTPLLLVTGAFLAAFTAHHVLRDADRRGALSRAARQVAIALSTLVALYALLYAATGYDVIAVYREVLGSKHDWDPELTRQELLGRPYGKALISDPWEFLLGTGWIIGLVAAFRAFDACRERSGTWAIEMFGLANIVLLPLCSFVRGESARLWMFLVPFLVLPAGVELARSTPRRRLLALGSLLAVLATIFVNMRFVER